MKKDYNSEKEPVNQKISEAIKGAPCAEAAAAIAKLEQRQKVVRTVFYLVELPELDEYDPAESDLSLLQYCYYRLIYDVAENIIKELENCQDTAKYETDMHERVEKFLSLPLRCMSKKNLVLLCNTLMALEFKNYRNGAFSDGVDQALQDEWLDYVKNDSPTWEGLHQWNDRLLKSLNKVN